LRAVTATQAAVLLPDIEAMPACRRVTSLRSERPERAVRDAPTIPSTGVAKGERIGAELDDYVALAAGGDVRAFEHLYRTHIPRVHSLVRRMAGGRDTDELTQDVFVRVWQKLGSFRGDSAFGTWLHRLAVNVIIERFRQDATRRQRLHDGEEIFDTLPSPPRSGDMRMDFEAALETLPDGAREIFVLHDVEGYKHHEIGTLLEISSGTSKAQLHRARMMLRRYLK
jgi:RNA polymerase sigma-70 factor, ECF subfamily